MGNKPQHRHQHTCLSPSQPSGAAAAAAAAVIIVVVIIVCVTFLAHYRYDCAVDVLVILQTESSTSPPASPSRFRLSSPSTRGIIMFSSFFNVVMHARGDFGQYGGIII